MWESKNGGQKGSSPERAQMAQSLLVLLAKGINS
jgi:hypothetical protein